jgi:hypothetical protein
MSKGSIFDVLIIAISLTVLAIGILVASIVMTNVQVSMGPTLDNPVATEALQQGTNAINTFNYGFVIIAVGLGLGSVIFAFLTPTHPIFMILSILMLMIFIIIIPQLSNVYQTMTSDAIFTGAAANFGLMSLIMNNLPLFSTVFAVMIMIALYLRWNSGRE